jgi:hypothetical protein
MVTGWSTPLSSYGRDGVRPAKVGGGELRGSIDELEGVVRTRECHM